MIYNFTIKTQIQRNDKNTKKWQINGTYVNSLCQLSKIKSEQSDTLKIE